MNARNTIIAKNTAPSGGPDFNGTLASQGFNLIGNNSGATITPAQLTDQIGTAGAPIDPLLGPLQNNGGPTQTQALLTNSPALDKGHSSGSNTDQRGFTRPVDNPAIPNATGGDGSDIGAFEVQLPAPTSAVSRKGHGTAGTFDVDLPLGGNPGIECRSGGANADYQVVLTFPSAVTFTSASATPASGGTGSVASTGSSADGTQITVNLTGVSNAQRSPLTCYRRQRWLETTADGS